MAIESHASKFCSLPMRTTPRLILHFIDRQGGWVNDYPLIEFFGAIGLIEELVANGHIEKTPLADGWSKYTITASGRAMIDGYDPRVAGDLPLAADIEHSTPP